MKTKYIRLAPKENKVLFHYRMLVGFSAIVDGLINLLSFGKIYSNFTLESARLLAKKRIGFK